MSTSAEIQYYQRNRDGIVEYHIKVVHHGKEWIVKRRYSEFSKLNDFVMKNSDKYEIKAKFPQKSIMWKKHDKRLLDKRFDELRTYFKELVKNYSVSDSSLLKEFLEVETVLLQHARKQSIAETIRLDRIPGLLMRAMIPAQFIGRKASSSMSQLQNFPALRKAKSFSSISSRTPTRKDSIQHDRGGDRIGDSSMTTPSYMSINGTRDRKFSIDIFNISTTYSSTDAVSLQMAIKRTEYSKATDALWDHYCKEIEDIEENDADMETALMKCVPPASYLVPFQQAEDSILRVLSALPLSKKCLDMWTSPSVSFDSYVCEENATTTPITEGSLADRVLILEFQQVRREVIPRKFNVTTGTLNSLDYVALPHLSVDVSPILMPMIDDVYSTPPKSSLIVSPPIKNTGGISPCTSGESISMKTR
jgi:hypothetical protein